jgi:hypothetical protein
MTNDPFYTAADVVRSCQSRPGELLSNLSTSHITRPLCVSIGLAKGATSRRSLGLVASLLKLRQFDTRGLAVVWAVADPRQVEKGGVW